MKAEKRIHILFFIILKLFLDTLVTPLLDLYAALSHKHNTLSLPECT